MLQINQSRQHDGLVFSLSPQSRVELGLKAPNVHPFPRVFIAVDSSKEFEESIYGQIVRLLSRLTEDELDRLGGFEVVDPGTDERIFTHSAAPALPEDIQELGRDVFDDPSKFSNWLSTPSAALGNVTPAEVLNTPNGAERILAELARIEHGVF